METEMAGNRDGTETARDDTRTARAAGSDAPPVVLAGLTKRFAGGVTAVDGIDLTVRRGAVLGLLGPNGSGKTSALRMLVGLLRPSAGSVQIFGQPMRPGHPVLRRVGTLVAGPAFVPHLSGRRNLEYYWRAGGEGLDTAHLDWALEVAGLGAAVDRRVRTYSSGMKQRLGLAQALLNDPDLLILDEPTVGLDPHELREVREVVSGIAERGATVMLSSHILAEVEEVCTDLAVLDHGHLIASGPIAELIAGADRLHIEVDDAERAREVLSRVGVVDVQREQNAVSVSLDGLADDAAVAALVGAGIRVRAVSRRRRLEDAFFELVERTDDDRR